MGSHFPHVLETILLMWRLMKIFNFWSNFHTNVYVKLFAKEVNLFCSWVRPNICVLDPFDIEVWKYIQYKEYLVSFTEVIQLQYSCEYGNWNSFKNRSKWTSAEMFLRRFSAAFRTESVKNTRRWLLPKCSFAEYLQSI